jgi:glucose-6-phosphate dehydrogenase assembly protein OpcA
VPVTRACLWNFVVRAEGDADYKYAKQLIDDVSQRIPARVIVVRPDGDGLRAYVEANWRRDGQGASGSDEVTLVGGGAEKLISLVRSLTIPDAPTAMMWIGQPPPEGAPARELIKDADRLVVDTRKLPSETGLATLARLSPELEIVDLSWLGISPLRGLCASFFDQDPAPLQKVERLRVTSGVQGVQTRALLAIGWMGSRLGWRDYRRTEGDGRRWQAARAGGGSVSIELATDLHGATHGVNGLTLWSGGDEWSLQRSQSCIDVRGPALPQRLQPARSHSDAELTVVALGPRGRDPVFRAALEHAGRLVES